MERSDGGGITVRSWWEMAIFHRTEQDGRSGELIVVDVNRCQGFTAMTRASLPQLQTLSTLAHVDDQETWQPPDRVCLR